MMWRGVEFCQMLFLLLLRWSCGSCTLFYCIILNEVGCFFHILKYFLMFISTFPKFIFNLEKSIWSSSLYVLLIIVFWILILSKGWSVQFSRSVMSNSLRPHELQHARPPCPSPTPGVYPNSCPLSRWCYPTISSSVIPFSSCPQSFPALWSFPMSQHFAWGGQSIGVSASTSVLEHSGLISFRMDWLDPLAVQGTLKSLLQHHSSKASVLRCSTFSTVQLWQG